MVSRSGKGDALTYEALNGEILAAHRLVVNTTPLGMHPGVEGFPPIPYGAVSREHLLFDLIYNPEKTRFLTLGEERGASIVNGYDMLVYQAEASWEIWNSMAKHENDIGV
jgi:shikimate dehydrogenase